MNYKNLFMIVVAFFVTQSVVAVTVVVHNVAHFPISVQSLTQHNQWFDVMPNQKIEMKTWAYDIAGITWRQRVGDNGNLQGCVYYFMQAQQNVSMFSNAYMAISRNGFYRTDMQANGGGQAKLIVSDRECNSFGSRPVNQ